MQREPWTSRINQWYRLTRKSRLYSTWSERYSYCSWRISTWKDRLCSWTVACLLSRCHKDLLISRCTYCNNRKAPNYLQFPRARVIRVAWLEFQDRTKWANPTTQLAVMLPATASHLKVVPLRWRSSSRIWSTEASSIWMWDRAFRASPVRWWLCRVPTTLCKNMLTRWRDFARRITRYVSQRTSVKETLKMSCLRMLSSRINSKTWRTFSSALPFSASKMARETATSVNKMQKGWVRTTAFRTCR